MASATMQIKVPKTSDRPKIKALLNSAFDREDESRLVEKLWDDEAMAIECIAKLEGKIVGYCAFSPVTASPQLEGSLFGLAPVAVVPTHQNNGIGEAIIREGLEKSAKLNATLVVVLGEPAYYQRFGFKPASAFNLTWSAMEAGDVFQAIYYPGNTDDVPRKINYHSAFDI